MDDEIVFGFEDHVGMVRTLFRRDDLVVEVEFLGGPVHAGNLLLAKEHGLVVTLCSGFDRQSPSGCDGGRDGIPGCTGSRCPARFGHIHRVIESRRSLASPTRGCDPAGRHDLGHLGGFGSGRGGPGHGPFSPRGVDGKFADGWFFGDKERRQFVDEGWLDGVFAAVTCFADALACARYDLSRHHAGGRSVLAEVFDGGFGIRPVSVADDLNALGFAGDVLFFSVFANGADSDESEFFVKGSRGFGSFEHDVLVDAPPGNVIECHLEEVFATSEGTDEAHFGDSGPHDALAEWVAGPGLLLEMQGERAVVDHTVGFGVINAVGGVVGVPLEIMRPYGEGGHHDESLQPAVLVPYLVSSERIVYLNAFVDVEPGNGSMEVLLLAGGPIGAVLLLVPFGSRADGHHFVDAVFPLGSRPGDPYDAVPVEGRRGNCGSGALGVCGVHATVGAWKLETGVAWDVGMGIFVGRGGGMGGTGGGLFGAQAGSLVRFGFDGLPEGPIAGHEARQGVGRWAVGHAIGGGGVGASRGNTW